jgi:hypothetical protein
MKRMNDQKKKRAINYNTVYSNPLSLKMRQLQIIKGKYSNCLPAVPIFE